MVKGEDFTCLIPGYCHMPQGAVRVNSGARFSGRHAGIFGGQCLRSLLHGNISYPAPIVSGETVGHAPLSSPVIGHYGDQSLLPAFNWCSSPNYRQL